MNDRRSFLASATAGVASLASGLSAASDQVSIAVVGCGERGARGLIPNILPHADVRIAAVCDVYRPNLDQGATAVGGKVDTYGDYRRILERKDIDVVVIATPDHWHGPITVAACEAGKDVYVEKPVSNSIEECLRMVEAARKHNRVVQVGLQQRSSLPFLEAHKVFQKGILGTVRHVELVRGGGGGGRGPGRTGQPPMTEPAPVPEGLDWEAFQGVAPKRPYVPMRQRNWRSYWEYGGGTLSDWGVHILDVGHWYMGVTQPPETAAAAFGTFNRKPDERFPDTVEVVWRYDKFVMSYSNRPESYGTYFWGSEGVLHVNRRGFEARPIAPDGPNRNPAFEPIEAALRDEGRPGLETDTAKHFRNFLDCVKTRQRPVADIEIAAVSTIPTLMGGMSIRHQGRTIQWTGKGARPLA